MLDVFPKTLSRSRFLSADTAARAFEVLEVMVVDGVLRVSAVAFNVVVVLHNVFPLCRSKNRRADW